MNVGVAVYVDNSTLSGGRCRETIAMPLEAVKPVLPTCDVLKGCSRLSQGPAPLRSGRSQLLSALHCFLRGDHFLSLLHRLPVYKEGDEKIKIN